MNIRITQKRNPLKPDDPQKFYMSPVYGTTIGLDEMAKKISESSYMSESNTLSVVRTLLKLIPELMMDGHIVSLGSFGRFRLVPSSVGMDTGKEFSTQKVRRLKVAFNPSIKMKAALAQTKYEPMRVYKGQIVTDEQVEDEVPALEEDVG